MPRTSNKKEEILQFLNRFMEENGYAPTVREIGKAVGLKSTATVHYHLEALQRENRISMPEMKKRAITVAGNKPGQIPILGTVTAGQPILAFENITGYIPWEGKSECFALRVRGDSMINAGIYSGDLVVVQPQQMAEQEQIVVALLGDEATVKRFRRADGHVWLLPENPAYAPIPADEATILGRVCALYRDYDA